MLLRGRRCVVLIVLVSALSRAVSTQSQAPAVGQALASRPVSSASRITEALSINGALDEDVWQTATPLTSFVQAEPFEGSPASENTEVRILYDDEAIYVGVILHDSDPSTSVRSRLEARPPRYRPSIATARSSEFSARSRLASASACNSAPVGVGRS